MKNKYLLSTVLIAAIFLIIGCASHRDLLAFKGKNAKCYNRLTEPYTSVVDSHLHFRPFGGRAIPFSEINDYLNKSGVLFVNVYGIGQSLPADSACEYYPDCPGTPAIPSIKNDFVNAANYVEYKPRRVHMTLSMSFPDLASPENIVEQIHLLDKEYPGIFKWMGEVNLVKQALFDNHHKATPKEAIGRWTEFMALLRERSIPIAIHSDLGNDTEPLKYLYLMEEALRLYPLNKIVWVHMELSKELTTMDPRRHIELMKSILDRNENLMLDISWRVLYDTYFKEPKIRDLYVTFFNEYSTRILPGTDFVASRKKNFAIYEEELEATGRINKHFASPRKTYC